MTRKLIDGDFTATHTLRVYACAGTHLYSAVITAKASGDEVDSCDGTLELVKSEGRRLLKEATLKANAKIEAKQDARALALAEEGLDQNGKEWFEQTFYTAKVEEAYQTPAGPAYMVTFKTASEDGTDVVCTVTDMFDKAEAEAIALLFRKNGPTVLALLQATTMFPNPMDEYPDSSDIAQMAEEEARAKARTPIEVLADACGLGAEVLVPEQCMQVMIGGRAFHVTMEEMGDATPAPAIPTFASYAAWRTAVEARGLSTDSYVDRENGLFLSAHASDASGQEVGMFQWGGDDCDELSVAVLFNTPREFQVWQDLRKQ